MLRNFQNITVNNPDLIPSLKQFFSNSFDTDLVHYYFSSFVQLGENEEVLKLLLQDPRVDPSYMDNFTIRNASENGHKEVVELLLKDPRVDPSDKRNYAIKWARYNEHNEVVDLIKQDPRVLAKSYKLGQNYHTEEQISEIKKSHPFLFI